MLDALVLQDNDGVGTLKEKQGVVSSTLWDSLKTTCLHLHRPDLAALCESKDLEGMFKPLSPCIISSFHPGFRYNFP